MQNREYEEVKDRLPRFLESRKNPRVITRLASPVEQVGERALFLAELYDGDTLLATGWAYEERDTSTVNRSSWIENCETSAIGRALANLGLHGSKRPSAEEMRKAERMEQMDSELRSEVAKLIKRAAKAPATKKAVTHALGDPKTLDEAAKAYRAMDQEQREALKALVAGDGE